MDTSPVTTIDPVPGASLTAHGKGMSLSDI
jgi:hypothetical protein